MTATLRLGFLPLVDAAPLIVAEALGFAEEEGLALDLIGAPSWSSLRDLLAVGQVDAAHMLAPVPVALALGLGGSARFDVLSVLNLNGNAIGVSTALAARMSEHDFAMTDAWAAGQSLIAATGGALRIGVPFAFSMHNELVRYWLEGMEQAPSTGIEIVTIPPPLMPDALAAGEIDAFCVGEPRGSVAVERGAGVLLLPTSAIWATAPEKVLAVRAGWPEAQPELAGRLTRAIWRAGCWLGQSANLTVAGEVLAARLGESAELIERSLTGHLLIAAGGAERVVPGFLKFDGGAAGFPWRSQAAWIGARLARRHGLNATKSQTTAASVFRSDLYRLNLRPAGADLPAASAKVEGSLRQPTPVASSRGKLILPPDQFFDAQVFDPGLQM